MDRDLQDKFQDAIWVAKALFDRNKVTGSTGNISFCHGQTVYISASGGCFGRLTEDSFAACDLDGRPLGEKKPSKELPLHLAIYRTKPDVQSVIHTHSYYATLWSCLAHENQADCMPDHTPYLKMKVGTVGLIPYSPPGSQALFHDFEQLVDASDGYLLKNHGPIVGGKSVMDAFFCLEELEESAHIALGMLGMPGVVSNL